MTYYDALLRPAYVERWDNSDVNATLRTTKMVHDSAGRLSFESYPRRTYGQIGPGIFYAYDALGRQNAKAAKSEVGEADGYAWTRTSYESGFRTVVRDPRQNVTTYSYQAFDEPVQDSIAGIVAPEGVTVTIARDVFGKPTSITRGNSAKSVTRHYVYDGAQRLCKTIEPESGATVQDYDGADNVAWRASGLALPLTTSCDTASVPAASKITYQYDARNRSTGSTYGDSSPAVAVTLTPDGLLNTVSSNGAVWTNTYSKRRLLERESLAYGGATYNISRAYDANGSLKQLTYPDNTQVPYNPNALGEPRQVGAYANAVLYHPNGGIASFNYGSTTTGIKHSTTQNERGLPLRSTDLGGVRDDQYGYDASGNVTSIDDLLPSNVSRRSMTYDGLDRLKTATAPNMWGSATYGYDVLDNLISTTITGGISARNTSHNFNAVTNRLTSITNGPPGFNVTYAYDSRGNVTQRNSQVFEYDLADRMKRAVGRATYTYDGFKRRVSVVGTDGVTRVQVYAQDGKLLYVAPSGGTPTKYVYMRNHVLAEVSGATVTYSHTDALGSPVAQSNAAGAILNRTRYEPYGYIVAGTPRTIGFTGHVNDNDTGLVYMQQRYYDAFAGRFLSVDPVTTDANTAAGFNRHAYASNSPYKYIDPDGREAACITIGTQCGLGSVSPAEAWARISTVADFVPGISDIKSVFEAVQDPSVANIVAVGLGIIPIVGDGAAKVTKATRTNFIVTSDGVVTHTTAKEVRESLNGAGMTGKSVQNPSGTETGTIHNVPNMKMDIRVMDGGPVHPARAVISRQGTSQPVNPSNGRNFGNVPKVEQRAKSHIVFPE